MAEPLVNNPLPSSSWMINLIESLLQIDVNTMYEITESFDSKDVEFVMGVISVADDIGISVAAAMSLGLEPWLSGHNPLVGQLCHHSS